MCYRLHFKWTSPNQPHWVQQGDALKNFISIAKAELRERVPDHLDHVYRNVSKLVVSNDVPQIVKELYLPILINWREPVHVLSSTMTTDEEYSEVRQMLFPLICLICMICSKAIAYEIRPSN